MSSLTLSPDNFAAVLEKWQDDSWAVLCLCAAWCDVCKLYRAGFDELASRHPDKLFLWVDIEDLSEVVENCEVENFPTLLIQQGDTVVFFGAMQPEPGQAHRLIQAQEKRSKEELLAESRSSAERRAWQEDCNLRAQLQACGDAS